MDFTIRAISDPTRRKIMDRLSTKDESVTELARDFDMSLPAVSQHLKVLQQARLIAGRREGRQIFYQLNPKPLKEVARWIGSHERFWRTRLGALRSHLRRKHG